KGIKVMPDRKATRDHEEPRGRRGTQAQGRIRVQKDKATISGDPPRKEALITRACRKLSLTGALTGPLPCDSETGQTKRLGPHLYGDALNARNRLAASLRPPFTLATPFRLPIRFRALSAS